MIQRVLIIIVDYQTTLEAQKLSLLLSQVVHKCQNLAKVDIAHVDNGNPKPVNLSSEQQRQSIYLITTPKNLGYAGGILYAIRQLEQKNAKKDHNEYDAYWLLNSDLEVDGECFNRLIQVLNQNSQVGAVGPLILNSSRNNQIWGARGRVSPILGTTAMSDWKSSGPLPHWSYLPGCSILVRAKAFKEAKGLPEFYKLYYEETELCIRLQKLGWVLWLEREAIAYHHVNSIQAGVPARHFAYYFIRNNLLFWKINFGIPIWIQFPRTLFVLFREVLFPLRRAKSFAEIADRVKYALAGLVDGIPFARSRKSWFEGRLFE